MRAASLLGRLTDLRVRGWAGNIGAPYAPDFAAAEPEAPPAPKPRKKMAAPALSLCVLVAEDNDINALLTRTLLEHTGHKVRLARNGVEAVAAIEADAAGEIDLVLMDLHMPGMDGFEATARIRALDTVHAALPIIALTANAMAEDRQACLDAAMDDYPPSPSPPTRSPRRLPPGPAVARRMERALAKRRSGLRVKPVERRGE